MSRARRGHGVVILEPREAFPDYLLGLAGGLEAAGVDCVIVSGPRLAEKIRTADLPGVRVRPYFNLRFRGGLRNLPTYAWGWARTVVLLLLRRPAVLHVQWLAKPVVESRAIPALARALGARLVYTAHNVLPHERSESDRDLYGRFYERCDRVVVHADAARAGVLALWPTLDPERIVVIPQGNADHLANVPNGEKARRRLGLLEGVPIVGLIGTIRPYKGTVDLLEAWQRSPVRDTAQLVIAGRPEDDTYFDEVRRRLSDPALENVRLIPEYLSDKDLRALFEAVDVVVLPYHHIDGSAILLYAMTTGSAIVASRLPSFVEACGEDEAAVFVEPGDREALASALARVVEDEGLRKQLGRRAKEVASRDHGWPEIGRRTRSLYETTAGEDAGLAASIAWLKRAQDASHDAGVAAIYRPGKGFAPSFPEITGYVIPTFWNAHAHGDHDCAQRATAMAEWLLTLQHSDGWFQAGTIAQTPSPSVFNTGQIIFGLIRTWEQTGDERFLEAASRAGDWLGRIQDRDGAWRRHDFLGCTHVYNTRTAWALLLLADHTRNEGHRLAGADNVSWAKEQAHRDGFFDYLAFDSRRGVRYGPIEAVRVAVRERNRPGFMTKASLHTIAYTIQGLLECAWILGDRVAEQTAVLGAETLARHAREGRLAGWYAPGWRREGASECLTGVAQMAIVWQRLAQCGRPEYLEAADRALAVLTETQRDGRLPGSRPIWGLYLPYRYPTWAVKFAADAYLLREVLARGGDAVSTQVW